MEKIDLLLEKLEGIIPASLGSKIDKLDTLKDSYEDAILEHEKNPSEESETTLKESKDYIDGLESSIIEQLQSLVDKKQNDAKTKEVEAQNKAVEPKTETTKVEPKEEKKESSGVLGLVIGAVLLVGSLGAINYFRNNR
jgi:ABC-type Na+ efflux pump permease subunit